MSYLPDDLEAIDAQLDECARLREQAQATRLSDLWTQEDLDTYLFYLSQTEKALQAKRTKATA